MTIHKIIYLTDPRLRTICTPIELEKIPTPEMQTLIDDMYETMYAARGVGLAANQIGICIRLAVIDVSHNESEKICMINPEIIETRGETKMSEGCLSVPGVYDTVIRPNYVKARALDRFGKPFEFEGEDLLAEAIQHEIDHLNGKLFIDLLSALKRERAKAKFTKHIRQNIE